ncbi:MAG: DUF1156 domain-containing protein [Anaerolineae bacterium]|nr:DUF1156 domain-containing protein [Anaerolineae bacterium]
MSDRRLIEVAFPLKQASLDSVHEKNVRHGHISTLHIWPARRPLAACRAALIATLLPDPEDDAERKAILEKLGGRVKETRKTKRLPNGEIEETVKEETEGGILHWGRESDPDLEWFREKIRAAYGGRAPRVLDPFAGGGAIPLEAMRLGCEATAVDINPVAWFILKCTLEYPQRLAGKTWPLPILDSELPIEDSPKQLVFADLKPKIENPKSEAALPDHVRYWGNWVLERARADLERYYPTVDGKTTVAYLWARTVTCKNCRAIVPLLKTTWLAKTANKRVVLELTPSPSDGEGVREVSFSVRELAKGEKVSKGMGEGTMSRAGATCPCCGAIMTMEDIRTEGQAGRLGMVMTSVVVDGNNGKEYRRPTDDERRMADEATAALDVVFADIPFGMPDELLPGKEVLGFRMPLYGFRRWRELFTDRQLLSLGTFILHIRASHQAMIDQGYSCDCAEGITFYLSCLISKLADKNSTLVEWQPHRFCIGHTFKRFALPMTWDFAEVNVLSNSTGNAGDTLLWIADIIGNNAADPTWPRPSIIQNDAQNELGDKSWDMIVTDPPYYDAIPYSDLMDFFYIWLRRTLYGLSRESDAVFTIPLAPKWNHTTDNGELIDDASRFDGDKDLSKAAYEDGMAHVFQNCYRALTSEGRLVIVFAHKQPDAWETLVSAIIRAGFVVDGSWPIETEMIARSRAQASAALASSVWLVCKKRPAMARPGWDNRVLDEMRTLITQRLRDFWDAGIRGPDFVWAATGPAMEAYSQYPVVKKADEPGQVMTVSEFLGHVRRMVVDFVVGRVLSGDGAEAITGLDDLTTYYLLHRHDFGLDEAPAGAAILYAISCNLSDRDLSDRYRLLEQKGSTLQLLPWHKRASVGYDPVLDAAESQGAETLRLPGLEAPEAVLLELPLIDQAHRLMHLWRAGDVTKVDAYLDARGLRRNALFHQLLQALIELASAGSEERALLESISNYIGENVSARIAKQLPVGMP